MSVRGTAHDAPFAYQGDELDVFKYAVNWKRYWGGKIRPYLGADVLEVGAGIGGTTAILCTPEFDSWTAIEPDAAMVRDLQKRQERGEFPANCIFRCGAVQSLPATARFDSILYIDVLEHIKEDRQELADAARHLRPGGHLVVLSPAFGFLYTAFDEAIGHQRRYTRDSLAGLTPPHLRGVRFFYLDAVAVLLSMGNRLIMRSPLPTKRQILFWDRVIVPISRWVDPIIGYRLGRSVIGIWQAVPNEEKS